MPLSGESTQNDGVLFTEDRTPIMLDDQARSAQDGVDGNEPTKPP